MKSKRLIHVLVLLAVVIVYIEWPAFQLDISPTGDVVALLILTAFLFVIKHYPMPLSFGTASLEFPIMYYLVIKHGFLEAILVLICVSLISDLIDRRSVQVFLFNSSNYIISYWIAYQAVTITFTQPMTELTDRMLYLTVFLLLSTIINNILVDLVLWVRPQAYTLKQWVQKAKLESFVVLINFAYLSLFYFFDHQNYSGNVFEITFFYMPLVTAAIIAHIITKLTHEKHKLEVLFQSSKNWSGTLSLEKVLDGMEKAIDQVLSYTFGMIYIHQDGQLVPLKIFGYKVEKGKELYLSLGANVTRKVQEKKETVLISRYIPTSEESAFKTSQKGFEKTAFIAAPICIDEDIYGVIVLGKERTRSYFEEDKLMLETLANHASMAIRNTLLVQEREKRLIAEERNRLAREIHDGIAQSMLAVTLKTETCLKCVDTKPHRLKGLLEDNVHKLRKSLKDIRQSIYALRPLPTQLYGLRKAIERKVLEFELSCGIETVFTVEGKPYSISDAAEEALYQILSESLQNINKHAQATQAQVTLDYATDHISLSIRDNGIGFSLSQALQHEDHFGIQNMNELAQKYDAYFQINTAESKGTEISISIHEAHFHRIRKDGVV
ncbi:GAF domain-containing sensor histidine kinase [Caldalkalibacillus salinus]|uniref:GAF domain-containing sensor histidine kinase n=1 Tax=Caldalkalibacillus salinus TaxID=2803787 RepID=UPI001922321F|nr:GAF domain-containing sensor histidine kinase [Caldalkalibacillus salinus]